MNNSHLSALRIKHAELESKLDKESSRPHPDDTLVHNLKKQKLHLKDAIMLESSAS